jgi:toxin CcdB
MARGATPYVVDVQSDFLAHLESRLVIPILMQVKVQERIEGLHLVVDIAGDLHVLVTHQLTSILKRDLERPVASLAAHHDEITRALDILFTGF